MKIRMKMILIKEKKIKIRNLTVFNSNNNINNKSKEIKSEPKKLNIILYIFYLKGEENTLL